MDDEVCTVERFHHLCHDLATEYQDNGGQIPEGNTLHDLGQRIKTLVLAKLPAEYVEFGPTCKPLVSSGTFDFVKPVPYSVLAKAAKAAGLVSNGNPHTEGA